MSVERICTLRGDGYASPRSRQRFPERARSMYLFTSRVYAPFCSLTTPSATSRSAIGFQLATAIGVKKGKSTE